MEHLETQLLNKSPYKPYTEAVTTVNFEKYNKKAIDQFDAETNLTPIPNKPSSAEKSEKGRAIKNKVQSIDEIYFEPEFTSTEFRTALRLLAKAISYSQISLSEFREGNFIGSDDAVHHIQSLLPELFCCRNLSESFGAIINSIQNALLNNRGHQLSEEKLLGVNEILIAVRNAPFMTYEKAIDVIMVFEDYDFIVEPTGFDFLTEFLND